MLNRKKKFNYYFKARITSARHLDLKLDQIVQCKHIALQCNPTLCNFHSNLAANLLYITARVACKWKIHLVRINFTFEAVKES